MRCSQLCGSNRVRVFQTGSSRTAGLRGLVEEVGACCSVSNWPAQLGFVGDPPASPSRVLTSASTACGPRSARGQAVQLLQRGMYHLIRGSFERLTGGSGEPVDGSESGRAAGIV